MAYEPDSQEIKPRRVELMEQLIESIDGLDVNRMMSVINDGDFKFHDPYEVPVKSMAVVLNDGKLPETPHPMLSHAMGLVQACNGASKTKAYGLLVLLHQRMKEKNVDLKGWELPSRREVIGKGEIHPKV